MKISKAAFLEFLRRANETDPNKPKGLTLNVNAHGQTLNVFVKGVDVDDGELVAHLRQQLEEILHQSTPNVVLQVPETNACILGNNAIARAAK